MGQEGLLNIPTPQSGNLELLRKIADLENSISELYERVEINEQLRATSESYGMVILSDSKTVTDKNGLAIPTRENNPSIVGTLANKIETRTSEEINISFLNINTECVSSNISYGFIKNGVGLLQIDAVLINNKGEKATLPLFSLSNCTLKHYAASDGISSIGKMYTIHILQNGDVSLFANANTGTFNIRHQILFRVA